MPPNYGTIPHMKCQILGLLFVLPLLIVSCGDSDEHKSSFNQKKPPPKPAEKALDPLPIIPQATVQKPKFRFPLFSHYEGTDWVQLTGVSGRGLFICFASPWCKHSKQMIQTLERFANEENGRVQVVIVDPDKYPKLAAKYKLEAVPHTLIYVEGMLLHQFRGSLSEESIRHEQRKALQSS